MMNLAVKTVVSRADLLRLYNALEEESLDRISAITGYYRKTKKTAAILPAIELTSTAKNEAKISPIKLSLDRNIDMPFWRPFSSTTITGEDKKNKPRHHIEVEPFQDKEIRADRSLDPPSQQSLCPWSRLWPFLRAALGAHDSRGAVDIPKVVSWAAQMRPFKRLPRIQRRGWAQRSMLIVDLDTRLIPFWQDMHTLYRHLSGVRGENGLNLISFEYGPYGPAHQSGDDDSSSKPFKPPEPDTPILIVSDLGLFGQTESIKKEWLRFGQQLRQAGCAPVALTPAPRRLWSDELTSVYRMACWDRGQRLPKIGGPLSFGSKPLACDEQQRNGTYLLMSLLSPAIRVEPALLRAARLLLPMDQADAGDEAAVWNHDHLRRSYNGFSFDPRHIAHWRKAFIETIDHDLRQRLFELIQAHHRHLSPAVYLEEQLIAAMILNKKPPWEAERFFWRCINTSEKSDFEGKAFLEAYMQRVPHRHAHDPGMWKSEVMCALHVSANMQTWQRGKLVLPQGADPACVALFAEQGLTEGYTLYQQGPCFMACKRMLTSKDTDTLFSAGSPVIDLTSSDGVLQVRSLEEETRAMAVNLKSPSPVLIEIPERGALKLTTNHQEVTLKSAQKPLWAAGWGRDELGLFVILPQEEKTRKAYWFAPGRYPVGDHAAGSIVLDDPDRAGLLDGGTVREIEKGFWWDEDDFKQTFRAHFQKTGWGNDFGNNFGTQSHYGFHKPAWADDFGADQYGIYAEFHVHSAVQRLRWIRPGEFMMGSPETEPEREDNEHQHKVILTRGFWLADTACTQALWQAVMGDNPSKFKGEDRPVDSVSWDDCQTFITRLNKAIPGIELCLPTEAQWEYACRAGTTTPFHFGDTITTDQVNSKGEYREQTVPVKSFPCNAWGLYEMHGNVWEWCKDWYEEYPKEAVVDPVGPNKGEYCVLRGGSWIDFGGDVRSANRFKSARADRYVHNGLRLARGQTRPAEPDKASRLLIPKKANQPQRGKRSKKAG